MYNSDTDFPAFDLDRCAAEIRAEHIARGDFISMARARFLATPADDSDEDC